jgi:hypothetical protein
MANVTSQPPAAGSAITWSGGGVYEHQHGGFALGEHDGARIGVPPIQRTKIRRS